MTSAYLGHSSTRGDVERAAAARYAPAARRAYADLPDDERDALVAAFVRTCDFADLDDAGVSDAKFGAGVRREWREFLEESGVRL